MNQKVKNSARFALLGASLGFALTLGVDAWAEKTAPEAKNELPLREIRQFTDAYSAIKSQYVDSVGDKKLLEQALSGMVAGLDPHSSYLDTEAYNDLMEGTEGEFGGLGIEVTKDGKNGVQVVTPIDDTPAAKAGVRSGDLIIKIDSTYTYDLPLSKCVKLMRGKPKTKITLQIARKGEKKPITINLVRDLIKVQSVKPKELSDGIGYIRISQFQERTEEDLSKALNSFKKSGHLKGVVLDLRNNPGGLLDAAVGVCSMFLPKHTLVVSTKGRTSDSNQEYFTGQILRHVSKAEPAPEEAFTVPVVVLINQSSASASEIVSGALQDHKRATLMGRRSFGKGSVQTVLPLPSATEKEPVALKITTARYYTPSGRSIQATGIKPDVRVDDTPEGNYPSFIIREADYENHITVKENEEKKDSDDMDPDLADAPAPKLTYKFGDEKDFPLQQAVRFLKGEQVETAEITEARLKKELKAKEAAEEAKKAGDKAEDTKNKGGEEEKSSEAADKSAGEEKPAEEKKPE